MSPKTHFTYARSLPEERAPDSSRYGKIDSCLAEQKFAAIKGVFRIPETVSTEIAALPRGTPVANQIGEEYLT
jgi:hypothetical protein